MHVLAVPLFRDATGVAVALTAWARHRCLQLYLGPKPVRRRALLISKGLLFFFFFFFFLFNHPGTFGGLNMLKNS